MRITRLGSKTPDGAKGVLHLSLARMSCCGCVVGVYGRVGRWPFLISSSAREDRRRQRWLEDQEIDRFLILAHEQEAGS